MEVNEMLQELYEAVRDDEIFDDSCEHLTPSDTVDFCPVCFIKNLYEKVSLDEPEFSEETTEKQRETIINLWESWLNQ